MSLIDCIADKYQNFVQLSSLLVNFDLVFSNLKSFKLVQAREFLLSFIIRSLIRFWTMKCSKKATVWKSFTTKNFILLDASQTQGNIFKTRYKYKFFLILESLSDHCINGHRLLQVVDLNLYLNQYLAVVEQLLRVGSLFLWEYRTLSEQLIDISCPRVRASAPHRGM